MVVEIRAKLDDLLHLLIVPVIEASAYQRCLAIVRWKALISVPKRLDLLLVVLDLLFILLASKRPDAWRPKEDSQYVLIASPAIRFLVRFYGPLGLGWQYVSGA